MKKTLAAAAIVIAAAPMSGSGVAATPQTVSGAETTAFPLDVAGVRLGMSASEARTALVKAGYAMSGQPHALNWPLLRHGCISLCARAHWTCPA